MDSYYSQEPCDITFISHDDNKVQDHVDRALKNLKEVQKENQAIKRQIEKIKNNPKAYLKPIRDQLSMKINSVREQNESLKKMVQRQKIPAYSQMTKKKVVNSYQNDNKSQKSSIRGSLQHRNPLSEIDNNSNYDKNDAASTCLNYNDNRCQMVQNQTYVIGQNDQRQRDALMTQIRLHLQKAQVVEEELNKISKKQKEQLRTIKGKQSKNSEHQLLKVYEYKKKLIKLLKKLKDRENTTSQLIRTYRQLHEDTLRRLQEATQNLQRIRQTKISEDVNQRYAQVIELQERLVLINQQLEQMDETKWLEQIAKELIKAVRRMNIDIPKIQNIRQLIDELCNILIEAHITTKKDGQMKLNMLKQYHQQQKKNNNKYIMLLKSKEQVLGKKLIQIQMSK